MQKVNLEYADDFKPSDKVTIESVYKMMWDDKVVKEKLKQYARDNDANMFIKSIFPDEFRRILFKCYMQNDQAFQRLMNDDKFQESIMNIMAKEFYKTLNSDGSGEQKDTEAKNG